MGNKGKITVLLLAAFVFLFAIEMPVSAGHHRHRERSTSWSINLNVGAPVGYSRYSSYDYYRPRRVHAPVRYVRPYVQERVVVQEYYPAYYEDVYVYPSCPRCYHW